MTARKTIAKLRKRIGALVSIGVPVDVVVWCHPGETNDEAIGRYLREHPVIASTPSASPTFHVVSWEQPRQCELRPSRGSIGLPKKVLRSALQRHGSLLAIIEGQCQTRVKTWLPEQHSKRTIALSSSLSFTARGQETSHPAGVCPALRGS